MTDCYEESQRFPSLLSREMASKTFGLLILPHKPIPERLTARCSFPTTQDFFIQRMPEYHWSEKAEELEAFMRAWAVHDGDEIDIYCLGVSSLAGVPIPVQAADLVEALNFSEGISSNTIRRLWQWFLIQCENAIVQQQGQVEESNVLDMADDEHMGQNSVSIPFDQDNKTFDDKQYRRHRRGRRSQNRGTFSEVRDESLDPDYFLREVVFAEKGNSPSITCAAQLDTFCQLPNPVISHDTLKSMGRESDLETKFKDPNCMGIGNNHISIMGVVRNMVFRIKGTSVTIRRDVYVTEALNGVADMILNANFIQKYSSLIFSKIKSFFGGWFSRKKESAEEKAQAEAQRLEAERIAHLNEAARLLKEAEKALEDALKKAAAATSASAFVAATSDSS